MDQLPIIVRQAWKRPATYVEETSERPFTIAYGRKLKPHGEIRGLGPVLKDAGIDRSQIQVSTRIGLVFHATLDVAGVRRYFRRCRPEEHGRLQAIDEDIVRVEAHLRLLRTTRREALADAWRRGHVVTVQELRERAEARLREIQR